MWCGNAVVLLPPDLQEAHLQQRFFDEKHPAYVVSNERRAFRWLEHSSRVQAIGKNGPWIVYQVRDAGPESRPWKAPPPLACAGKEPACRKQLGR
jgi:hypothetical protein